MPPLLRFATLAAFAALAAFGLTRWLAPTPTPPNNEVAWLTREFQLTPAQASHIAALHTAYQPVCEEHCRLILEASQQLADADSPEARLAAEQALDARTLLCQDATRAHLHAVAAVMDPLQAARYLAAIEPRLADHEHLRPLGLK